MATFQPTMLQDRGVNASSLLQRIGEYRHEVKGSFLVDAAGDRWNRL